MYVQDDLPLGIGYEQGRVQLTAGETRTPINFSISKNK
jgi:hypothetical protein